MTTFSPDEIALFFDDAIDFLTIAGFDGFFKEINKTWTEQLGWSKEELLSEPFIEFVHPEDKNSTLEARSELSKGRKIIKYQNRYRKKDGTYIWLSWKSYPMEDKGLIYAVSRDITEERIIHQNLRESESKFRSIIEGAPLGILMYELCDNNDLILITTNSAAKKILNIDLFKELGNKIEEIFPNLGELPDIYRNIAKNGKFYKNEQVAYKDEKINSIYEVTAFQTSQNVVCVFFQEILDRIESEKKKIELERQILHSQKLESLGVLAGGIAHDFNNLIMGILGNLELALMENPEKSAITELINNAKDASLKAADLTRQLLAYSGKGKFVIRSLNISKLLTEGYNLLKTLVSKNINLKLDLDNNIPLISADTTQIQQILMNIIINASEAIGEENNGTITITTGVQNCTQKYLDRSHLRKKGKEGKYVYCEISDTGCGMDKKTLARIFDPFFTTKFTGRGLGLSAVLGIVEGHDGAIMAYSELNKGTTFKVLFPVFEDPDPSNKLTNNQIIEEYKLNGTVLIVDDEELVLSTAKLMVKKMGLSSLVANNGIEAVELFKKYKEEIKCVILDLTMPKMGGKEAFSKLREIEPNIKIILSSGYNQQDVVQKFAGRKITGFIQKPYEYSDLKKILYQVLQS